MLDSGLATVPVALTIAGSDPSGGAGLQADLKTFHQFGAYGMAVPTLLTVQNTMGIQRVTTLEASQVRAQLDCATSDIRPGAAKSGALGSSATVAVVAEWARATGVPLVVDPVLTGSDGTGLGGSEVARAVVDWLLPVCALVTPNLPEAQVLAGMEVKGLSSMQEAAARIAALGASAVLVKGGHLRGAPLDLLWRNGHGEVYRGERIETSGTHGTGCSYSAAVTALVAGGDSLEVAVAAAKAWMTRAIRSAPGLGMGPGPLNHHARVD